MCPYDFEPRHPQDYVRSVKEDLSVENARPEPDLVFACDPVYEVDVMEPNIYVECVQT